VVASGSADGTVRIWDADSGTTIRTLTGHDGWVSAVTSWQEQDQRVVVSAGHDQTVRLWRLPSAGATGPTGQSAAIDGRVGARNDPEAAASARDDPDSDISMEDVDDDSDVAMSEMDEAATPLLTPHDGEPVDGLALSRLDPDLSSVVGPEAKDRLESLLAAHARRVAETIDRLTGVSDPDEIMEAHQLLVRELARGFGADVAGIAWDEEPIPGRRARFRTASKTILIRPGEETNLKRLNETLVHENVHAAQRAAIRDPDGPAAALWGTAAVDRWRASMTGDRAREATRLRDQYRAATVAGTDIDQLMAFQQIWTDVPHEADARDIAARFGQLVDEAITARAAAAQHLANDDTSVRRGNLRDTLARDVSPSDLTAIARSLETRAAGRSDPHAVEMTFDAAALRAIAAAPSGGRALTHAMADIATIRTQLDKHRDVIARYEWITILQSVPTLPRETAAITIRLAEC
jgi:hypothetical protein